MSTYELKVEENSTGELYFTIPPDLLARLGWEPGDEVKFVESSTTNGFLIQRKKYETVELDFSDEELYKFMLAAHERGQSFNEFVESAITFAIDKESE